MNASPEAIWALVSDVTRIGEFSPETFEAQWLGGASGPAIGARFRGHVKRNGVGPIYWSVCTVTVCTPPEVFEFVVGVGDTRVNTWRYQITPTADGGADVTESYRLAVNPATRVYWSLLGWARGRTNERGMRQTLERMRAAVEAS